MVAIKDETGNRFSRLLVIRRMWKNAHDGSARWLCKCDCGNLTVAVGRDLRNGHKRSCGCLQKEKAIITSKARSTWGNAPDGVEKTRLHAIWGGMKQRCYNRKNNEYAYYGGKGITICDEWLHNPLSFYVWALAAGYKDGLTIDRKDNSKGYCPENCRFITRAEQNRNTTRNNKVFDERTGLYITTREVAIRLGLSRSTTSMWFRKEGIRTMKGFVLRRNLINKTNRTRTRFAQGLIGD